MHKSKVRLAINRKAFKAWLAANPKREWVVWDETTCPFATYIEDVTGYAPDVNNMYVTVEGTFIPTPLWLEAFIAKVDEYNGEGGVTSSKCIEILEG